MVRQGMVRIMELYLPKRLRSGVGGARRPEWSQNKRACGCVSDVMVALALDTLEVCDAI